MPFNNVSTFSNIHLDLFPNVLFIPGIGREVTICTRAMQKELDYDNPPLLSVLQRLGESNLTSTWNRPLAQDSGASLSHPWTPQLQGAHCSQLQLVSDRKVNMIKLRLGTQNPQDK